MSRDPDEIRHEIDETRDELGETLEAIGARMAPSHVAQQVRGDVEDKLGEIGDKVSPKRILERRTEGLRRGLRSVVESGARDGEGGAAVPAGLAGVGPRLRRMSATAAEQASAAPPDKQAEAKVLAAFGGGVALTAILPAFARRRPFALVVGAVLAGVARARLIR
jgi:hypothetical protein